MSQARSRSIFYRKSVETLQNEGQHHGLRRALGPVNLTLLGVGGIVGSGIYVMTGIAAANFAGPAVLISFLIAALACGFTALCYAELASTMPVAGSAYSYCYAALGEVFAWIVGWLMLFDFGLAGSSLAVGLSAYVASLARDFGFVIPAALTTPTFQAAAHGSVTVSAGASVNLVAAFAVGVVTLILTLGISASAKVNTFLVSVKVLILVVFVAVSVGAIEPQNWTPFVPENEGGFTYGWPGIARAAALLFFAYLGFEIVSTAASECRNPQKDMPFALLGALGICSVLYVLVAAVMTGLVPFRQLGVPDALAMAAERGYPQFGLLIKIGALTGISSVLLVNGYGQSRVAFAVGQDGLLPPLFSRLHPKFRTPYLGIILLGVLSAAMAATLPLSMLTDLVSLGLALCFSIVAISVMWLRSTRPDLRRPFRVPLGGVWIGRVWIGIVPVAAILMCWGMMVPVILDLSHKAASGNAFPALFVCSYLSLGALIYIFYGRRRSRVGPDAGTNASRVGTLDPACTSLDPP